MDQFLLYKRLWGQLKWISLNVLIVGKFFQMGLLTVKKNLVEVGQYLIPLTM